MSDRKLTVLELHFGDVQIGPKVKESGDSDEETTDLAVPSGSGRSLPVGPKPLIGAVVGLGLLGAIAVAAKTLRGNDADQATLDDPEFTESEEFESPEFED